MILQARRAARHPAVVVLGFRPADPGAYGRLVIGRRRHAAGIVEARDATGRAARIGLCNAGIMAIDGARLFRLLDPIGNDNAKNEYYLTDIVAIARERRLRLRRRRGGGRDEVMGDQPRTELARRRSRDADAAARAPRWRGRHA